MKFNRLVKLFSTTLLLFLFFSNHAEARRYALVIGIDDYENVKPLRKAVNDAKSIRDAVENLGFNATLVIDPDLVSGPILPSISPS